MSKKRKKTNLVKITSKAKRPAIIPLDPKKPVVFGPNWTPMPKRPPRRMQLHGVRLDIDRERLIDMSMSKAFVKLCAEDSELRMMALIALRGTTLGYARSLIQVVDNDGGVAFACIFPYRRWQTPTAWEPIQWKASDFA